MTPNQPDSEKPTATYNTETPAITDNTNTSREVEKTLLGRLGRRPRNIATSLIIALGAQGLLTGCSPDNEPNIIKPEENISINVPNNGANNIDISNSPIVKIEGNTLRIGYNTMAQWPENIPSSDVKIIISPSKYFSSKTEITSGSTLSQDLKGQYLGVEVKGKKALIGELVDKAEEQINKLQNLNYKVDEPIDLTLGGTLNIKQASFEIDGEVIPLETSNAIFPWPGNGILHFTIIKSDGTTKDQDININVEAKKRSPIELQTINTQDSLPKIDNGNQHIAEDLERFGYVSAWCIIDMAQKYGIGKFSPSEYKNELKKYYVGIVDEKPDQGNYNVIGSRNKNPSDHAHIVRSILDGIIHNIPVQKIVLLGSDKDLFNFADEDPTHTIILGKSLSKEFFSEEEYNEVDSIQNARKKEYDKKKNIIYAIGISNVGKDKQGNYVRGVLQHEKLIKPEYIKTDASFANGKNENTESNIVVVTSCKINGDLDISNTTSGPRLPSGFSPLITFGGVTYPRENTNGKIFTDDVPPTSYATPNVVGAITLCAILNPEAKGNDILDMIRNTAETKYMTLHNETTSITIPSPAGTVKKYLSPINLPSEIKTGEMIELNKGKYKGIVFNIPGAEVRIEGQGWIPYNDENKLLIQQYNPFKLNKWRLNGTLCRKYFGKGKVNGKITFVKDTWEDTLINKNIDDISII